MSLTYAHFRLEASVSRLSNVVTHRRAADITKVARHVCGSPILLAHGLTKSYGRVPGITEVDLELHRGTITGLLGPNGAGKSTLLHCLTGLQTSDTGTVMVDQIPVSQPGARARIGFAPDDLAMAELLTGWEFLDLVDSLARRPSSRSQWLAQARALRLDGALDRLILGYSHGMRRKLSLLAAISHHPDVLICDEPLRGLDPETTVLLKKVITALAAGGAAVLISTHDLLVAAQLCDQVVVLADGTVVASGPVGKVVGDSGEADLELAFLRLTGLQGTAELDAAALLAALGVAP